MDSNRSTTNNQITDNMDHQGHIPTSRITGSMGSSRNTTNMVTTDNTVSTNSHQDRASIPIRPMDTTIPIQDNKVPLAVLAQGRAG